MSKKINFYAVGGQYEAITYGGAETLRGAELIASRNREHWDNWQGWQRPAIYCADDMREIISRGRITTRDGVAVLLPRPGAEPVAVYDNNRRRWTTCAE